MSKANLSSRRKIFNYSCSKSFAPLRLLLKPHYLSKLFIFTAGFTTSWECRFPLLNLSFCKQTLSFYIIGRFPPRAILHFNKRNCCINVVLYPCGLPFTALFKIFSWAALCRACKQRQMLNLFRPLLFRMCHLPFVSKLINADDIFCFVVDRVGICVVDPLQTTCQSTLEPSSRIQPPNGVSQAW